MKKYLVSSFLFFSVLTAFAQDSEQAAADPNVGIEQFEDWAVRCAKQAAIEETSCEMVQFAVDNKAKQELLGVVITYADQIKDYWIQFRVPVDISIVQGTVIRIDGKEKANVVPFTRCLQGVCLAEAVLSPELRKLFVLGVNGVFAYLNGKGETIALPMSFKGFTAAMRALESKK